MALILCRLIIATLHFLRICCLKLRYWSIHVPRYLITSLLGMLSPFTLMLVTSTFLSCCLDPNTINSVLVVFIFRRFRSIHVFILTRASSSNVIVCFSCKGLGMKDLFIPWSSTYLCKSMWFWFGSEWALDSVLAANSDGLTASWMVDA